MIHRRKHRSGFRVTESLEQRLCLAGAAFDIDGGERINPLDFTMMFRSVVASPDIANNLNLPAESERRTHMTLESYLNEASTTFLDADGSGTIRGNDLALILRFLSAESDLPGGLGDDSNATRTTHTAIYDFLVQYDVFSRVSIDQSSVRINEGDGLISLNIVREFANGAVSFEYSANSGTATAGSDFGATTGRGKLRDGETHHTVSIPIHDDSDDEIDETFTLSIQSLVRGIAGTTEATITIADNEYGTLSLVSNSIIINETAGSVRIPVERRLGTDGTQTIDYQTFDAAATAGLDYQSRTGTLTFEPGETLAHITVPIINDSAFEGNEGFRVTVDHVQGGAILGAPRTATVTILDDEAGIDPLVDFDSFRQTNDLSLNGDANASGSALQLTRQSSNRTGSAFLLKPIEITANLSYTTSFSFSAIAGTSGRGNFAFVLQNSEGGSGTVSDSSQTSTSGMHPSVAVSIDTASESDETQIAIATVGRSQSSYVSALAPEDFSTGDTWNAWLDYDAATQLLRVFIDSTTTKPAAPIVEASVNLLAELGARAFAGFAAASGNSETAHLVHTWEFVGNTRLLAAPPEPTTLISEDVVTGLEKPTSVDWTPDGRNLYVSEQRGIVYTIRNGQRSTFIDFTREVNGTRDRGLLDIAVHPDFETHPYVYLLYTYDPPEVFQNRGLAGPDGSGNRAARLTRVTADASTNYTTAVENSEVTILGTNSTWENFNGAANSTTDFTEPPGGIRNGVNVRDFIATDSESHTIGSVEFGPDGALYVTTGDGTSYNRVDARAVRVQDIDNLSGKLLRIDPLNGDGLSDNPFYNGDPGANRSKVFQYGLRNPFRMSVDRLNGNVYIGDVGWSSWEELNHGAAGANFGWPYYEGGRDTSNRQGEYASLAAAQAFYQSGQAVVAPALAYSHAGDAFNAIVLGDVYRGNAFPNKYRGRIFFADLVTGVVRAARLNATGGVESVETFTNGPVYLVAIKEGPDGNLYWVDLDDGKVGRWRFAASGPLPATGVPTVDTNVIDAHFSLQSMESVAAGSSGFSD